MNVPLLPPKQPAETRTLTFDFLEEMAVGDTLVSVSPLIVSPSGLTLSTGTILGSLVSAQISGGTADVQYMVTCRVTTGQGDVLELSAMIDVRNPVPWGAAALEPTSLTELENSLAAQIGDLQPDVLDPLLIAAVGVFNAEAAGTFVLDGLVLDRVATAGEQRLLVLYAARLYIDQKLVQSALAAVTRVNPAGRTELTEIPAALERARKAIQKQIDDVLAVSNAAGIVAEIAVVEIGETKDVYRAGFSGAWPLP